MKKSFHQSEIFCESDQAFLAGTTVIVHDMFKNQPVRSSLLLKDPRRELEMIRQRWWSQLIFESWNENWRVEEFSLSNFQCAFQLIDMTSSQQLISTRRWPTLLAGVCWIYERAIEHSAWIYLTAVSSCFVNEPARSSALSSRRNVWAHWERLWDFRHSIKVVLSYSPSPLMLLCCCIQANNGNWVKWDSTCKALS